MEQLDYDLWNYEDVYEHTCSVCDKPIDESKSYCSERCYKSDLR